MKTLVRLEEGLAHPPWLSGDRTGDQLPGGRGHDLGKAGSEGAPGGRRKVGPVLGRCGAGRRYKWVVRIAGEGS